MLSKIKDNLGYAIGAVFTILLGLFAYERKTKIDAEAKLDVAKDNQQDAALAQQSTDLQAQIAAAKAAGETANSVPKTTEETVQGLDKL